MFAPITHCLLATLTFFFAVLSTEAAVRTWQSSDGQTFRGELISADRESAEIKRADNGQLAKIPLTRFALKDQYYISDKKRLNLVVIGDPERLQWYQGYLRGYWTESDGIVTIHVDEWVINGKGYSDDKRLENIYFWICKENPRNSGPEYISNKVKIQHPISQTEPLVLRDLEFTLDVNRFDQDEIWFAATYETINRKGERGYNRAQMDYYPFTGKRRK